MRSGRKGEKSFPHGPQKGLGLQEAFVAEVTLKLRLRREGEPCRCTRGTGLCHSTALESVRITDNGKGRILVTVSFKVTVKMLRPLGLPLRRLMLLNGTWYCQTLLCRLAYTASTG